MKGGLYHLVTLRHGDDMPLLVGREYCRSAAMDLAKRAAGPGASFICAFPEPFSCAYQGPNGIAVVSW
jgi:hypothetical protein